MPVDNQLILDKIEALGVKMGINNKERKDLANCIDTLRSICEEDDPNSVEIPKAKRVMTDRGTGEIMNAQRRQTVYDAQIIKADALLS
jgi:hypothetical protein